jgi:predicted alpha/beta superfamily hydrolase
MSYRWIELQEHLIESQHVPQTFKLRVQIPMCRADGSERFPVLYAADSDDYFEALARQAAMLQLHGEAPRFILVGVGYENPRSADALRLRDLFTHSIRSHFRTTIEQLLTSPLVEGVDSIKTIVESTDASDFLRFVRAELIPFIEAHYPTVADENTYFGYSAGGTFGLFTLFTQPETFKRYILGSPGTSCEGHNFAIELAQAFFRASRRLDAKVFMSVGELEEFKKGLDRFDLVSGCYQFAKYLKQAAISGLDLTFKMFPDETHATAWTRAFNHGVKTLLGSVDQVPFWPDYLK